MCKNYPFHFLGIGGRLFPFIGKYNLNSVPNDNKSTEMCIIDAQVCRGSVHITN